MSERFATLPLVEACHVGANTIQNTPIAMMNPTIVLAALFTTFASAAQVTVLTVPDKGVQPQALVDSKGVLHLVFLAGPASQCDIFHTTLDAQTRSFAKPQRINRTSGSGIAVGTIRGAQCAFGKDDRLHVVWNGGVDGPDGKRRSDVFYTRSDGMIGFEPERPLMHLGMYLDGGCTVAADAAGSVYAMWHAAPLDTPKGLGELARTVYVATSHDEGKTFATEVPVKAADTGVCACCSMRATALPNGEVIALYRSADGKSRGMQLMRSSDQARSFSRSELQPWPINACPMSSSFMQPTTAGMLAAWETDNTIWMTNISEPTRTPFKVSGTKSKHPSFAQNERGETLITWAIGTGWQRGGTLAWSVLDEKGKVIEETTAALSKRDLSVPMWSYPAAAFVKSLGFVVFN